MRMIGTLTILVLLTACGSKAPGGNDSFTSAMDSSFRTSFKDKFVPQCVSSAKSSGPAAASIDFTPVCSCAADKLLANKSMTELMSGVSPQEGQAVIAECVKEHPLQKG